MKIWALVIWLGSGTPAPLAEFNTESACEFAGTAWRDAVAKKHLEDRYFTFMAFYRCVPLIKGS